MTCAMRPEFERGKRHRPVAWRPAGGDHRHGRRLCADHGAAPRPADHQFPRRLSAAGDQDRPRSSPPRCAAPARAWAWSMSTYSTTRRRCSRSAAPPIRRCRPEVAHGTKLCFIDVGERWGLTEGFMTNKVSRRAFGAGVLATGLIGKAAPSLAQGEPKRGGTLVATWGGGEPQACYVPAGGGSSPDLLLVQAVRAAGQPPHGRRVRGRAGGSLEARRRLQVLHHQDPQGREVPRRQGHDRRRRRLFDRRDLEEVRRRLGADRLRRRRGAGCRHRRRQVQQAGSRILLLLAAVRQRELHRAQARLCRQRSGHQPGQQCADRHRPVEVQGVGARQPLRVRQERRLLAQGHALHGPADHPLRARSGRPRRRHGGGRHPDRRVQSRGAARHQAADRRPASSSPRPRATRKACGRPRSNATCAIRSSPSARCGRRCSMPSTAA